MKQVWTKLNLFLTSLSGIFVAIMMVISVSDICARLVFNKPIMGISEILSLLLPVCMLLPLAYVESMDSNVRVDLITSRLSLKWQNILDMIASVLGALFFGCLAWYGWEFAKEAWNEIEYFPGFLDLQTAPTKSIIAFAFSLCSFQFIICFFKSLKKVMNYFMTIQNI